MKKILVTILVAASMVGCAHRQPVSRAYAPIPFDEAEAAAIPKTGTGSIRGQVFAKTVGGDVKKGAGNEVVLVRSTKFWDQWYLESYISHRYADPSADDRHMVYRQFKTTDGEGRFEFTNLPAGQYYVMSSITWQVPQRGFAGWYMSQQGGAVSSMVTVTDGAVTEAMLSK